MKKLNRLFLILWIIDLIVLLGYGQAQQQTNETFTYYWISFYWLYFFPAAYFFGGYLFGQLLLCKSQIALPPTAEKVLLTLSLGFLIVYLAGAIVLNVHVFTAFLPLNIAEQLSYFILGIFNRWLVLFSALGQILFVCLSSRNHREKNGELTL